MWRKDNVDKGVWCGVAGVDKREPIGEENKVVEVVWYLKSNAKE